ncbi:MAG: DNA/RNA non-specific endonuclease [Bacteroidales bacterium]|nr:DNA/RNA non-specific endonuclease [Bacteroidales bacterium]
MLKNTNIRYIWMFCFASLLFTVSCGKEPEASKPEVTIEFNGSSSDFDWNKLSGLLRVNAPENESWTLNITYLNEEEEYNDWCRLSASSGTGNRSISVNLDYNLSKEDRSASITVTLESTSLTASLPLRQYGQSWGDDDTPDVPADFTALELPMVVDAAWVLYYSKGEFTLEYSPTKKHSKWVAWKLHRGHLGTSGRTDAWQFDSRIPAQYRPTRNDFSGYDRGHIVPSADRTLSREMNAETFMYSNMTPQNANLNQQTWATIETRERNWVSGYDTLYICAGGTILNESDISHYTSISQMAVPKYNFKVILRKKASTGAYDAIGFWFENRYYGRQANVSDVQTVRYIEEKTGIDFFYNLPQSVQDEVENQFRPQDWGF